MVAERRAAAIVAFSLALAACDNTPDATFQQSARERDAARAGDQYASLEGALPKLSIYSHRAGATRRDYAAGEARTYRATYQGLLGTLDADTAVDRSGAVFMKCHRAFQAATNFQPDRPGADDPRETAAALTTCRNDTLGDLSKGDARATAELLRRFASTGIVLVGVTAAGAGQDAAGQAMWRNGEGLVAQDKPGFKLNLKAFML